MHLNILSVETLMPDCYRAFLKLFAYWLSLPKGQWWHCPIEIKVMYWFKDSTMLKSIGPDCNSSTVNVWFRSGHMVRPAERGLNRNVQLWEKTGPRRAPREITQAKAKIFFQLYPKHLVSAPHKTVQHAVNKSFIIHLLRSSGSSGFPHSPQTSTIIDFITVLHLQVDCLSSPILAGKYSPASASQLLFMSFWLQFTLTRNMFTFCLCWGQQ